MKYLNTAIFFLAAGLNVNAKITSRGRRVLRDESNSGDTGGNGAYGGKKTGYDADGAYGGKKGCDQGKKGGYDADGAYAGKKVGYDSDGDADGAYAGKKAGYDADGAYSGKKGGYDCPEPTPEPTPENPTRSPAKPTSSPVKATPVPTPVNPTPSPTKATRAPVTPEPTPEPTPTPEPIPETTPEPTPETTPPTPEPTPEPLCVNASVKYMEGSSVPMVEIEFDYDEKDPLPSDWVGLYPCDTEKLPRVEPTLWAYTCYSRVCRRDPVENAIGNGSFIFDDATLASYSTTGTSLTLQEIVTTQPGCYYVLLNRIDGDSAPPYYNICVGNEIELVPGDGPPINPTPAPVNPTPAPGAAAIPAACDVPLPATGCSVCGLGKFASSPNRIFSFPGQPAVSCGLLESSGLDGIIPLDQCGFLPAFVLPDCDCVDCPQ